MLNCKGFCRSGRLLLRELDAIHPFREGNSRTLRSFVTDLAMQGGYHLDWSRTTHDEEDRKRLYFARDMAVVRGDSSQLASFIEKSLSPVKVIKQIQTTPPRYRLLVMNGQRIIQKEQISKTWITEHVAKAGDLKPGIYNLYLAHQAEKGKTYEGLIVHVDDQSVYQKVRHGFIKHSLKSFESVPEIGCLKSIGYDPIGQLQCVNASKRTGRRHLR